MVDSPQRQWINPKNMSKSDYIGSLWPVHFKIGIHSIYCHAFTKIKWKFGYDYARNVIKIFRQNIMAIDAFEYMYGPTI